MSKLGNPASLRREFDKEIGMNMKILYEVLFLPNMKKTV